jgi:hypothetical protein
MISSFMPVLIQLVAVVEKEIG